MNLTSTQFKDYLESRNITFCVRAASGHVYYPPVSSAVTDKEDVLFSIAEESFSHPNRCFFKDPASGLWKYLHSYGRNSDLDSEFRESENTIALFHDYLTMVEDKIQRTINYYTDILGTLASWKEPLV